MYTVHNVGEVSVIYEIDTRPLDELNQSNYGKIILECLQPKGLIAPRSFVSVEFVFSPLEAKHYTVSLLQRGRVNTCMYVYRMAGIFRGYKCLWFSADQASTANIYTHEAAERLLFRDS